jgi:soluble lytic murein transglycosylase-like protein
MQLMDSTATDMGVSKAFEPRQNILGGTKYLKQLLDKYNGNETLALASYNAGPAAVDKYNGIPPYPETQHYVASVSALKQRFSAQIVTPAKETPDE